MHAGCLFNTTVVGGGEPGIRLVQVYEVDTNVTTLILTVGTLDMLVYKCVP